MSYSSFDRDRTIKRTNNYLKKNDNRSIFIVKGDNNQSAFFFLLRIYVTVVTHDETIITNRKCVFYCQNCETCTASVKQHKLKEKQIDQ